MSRLCSTSQVSYHFIKVLLLSSKPEKRKLSMKVKLNKYSSVSLKKKRKKLWSLSHCASGCKMAHDYLCNYTVLHSQHLSRQQSCHSCRNAPSTLLYRCFFSVSGKLVTRGRLGVKQSQQFTFPLLLSLFAVLLCLSAGVWYHGSVPSRLHLERSSAESGAKELRILVDLQPNRRPDTLRALSGPWGLREGGALFLLVSTY